MAIHATLAFWPSGTVFGITGLDESAADLIVKFIGRRQFRSGAAILITGPGVLVYLSSFRIAPRGHVSWTRLQTRAQTSAEQPSAEQSSQNRLDSESLPPLGSGGAAQPFPAVNDSTDGRRLQECSHWLNTLSPEERSQSEVVQRVQLATALLQRPRSRQQRRDVQQFLGLWDVRQKTEGRKRKYEEVYGDLVGKVVAEARRLQNVHEASEAERSDASITSPSGRFSAIRVSLAE